MTMRTILIYGESDDLIEVDSKGLGDEFDAYRNPKWLHFSDGTVVKCSYDKVPDKGWAIEVVKLGPGTTAKTLDPVMDDGEHYTDQLEITGEIDRVDCWNSETGPTSEDIETWWENFDAHRYPDDKLIAAMRLLTK